MQDDHLLGGAKNIKWYFKPAFLVIAVFIVGPFALPLIWASPSLKKIHKIGITVFLALLTYWMIVFSVQTYKLVKEQMLELQNLLDMK